VFFVNVGFAILGFLSPSSRGSLVTMALLSYVFFSTVSGYVSSVMYKTLQGENWRKNIIFTAILMPLIIFAILISVNFVLISRESSSALPLGTLVAIGGMWIFISMPLCVLGAFFGFKHAGFDDPCRTNQIPRQIPPQPAHLNGILTSLLGGIIPFGAILIELYFIMSSIWSHRIYYMFGFLFLIFIIVIVMSSLVSILVVYFKLCAEVFFCNFRIINGHGAHSSHLQLVVSICFYIALSITAANSQTTIFHLHWFTFRGLL
jgi:transmembrane 9 superfamily protein 2/4